MIFKHEDEKVKVNPFVSAVAIALVVLIVFTSAAYGIGYHKGKIYQKDADQVAYEQLEAERLAEEQAAAEETSGPIKEEARYIAKLLYGQAFYNDTRAQQLIVWLVLNRVDDAKFPNTVQGVCEQESQWMGYSDDNPVEPDLYDLAYNELLTWHEDGTRLIKSSFLYMNWSRSEIILRTTFEETADTVHFSSITGEY